MVFIYCKNRTETLSRGLFVKGIRKLGFSAKRVDLDLRSRSGAFVTGASATPEADMWDPVAHMSVAS